MAESCPSPSGPVLPSIPFAQMQGSSSSTPTTYRYPLKAAALAAGLSEERAHHLSHHDWRHASLTHMASRTTDLAGLAYLAGHEDVTTTAKYAHAHRRAAERVIAAVAVYRAANGSEDPDDGLDGRDPDVPEQGIHGTIHGTNAAPDPETQNPAGAGFMQVTDIIGAEERNRTSTGFTPQESEDSGVGAF